jgi:hypothetical protein
MSKDEQFGADETRRRFEAALRGSRLVGHKPQSEMKLGKPTGKRKVSPKRRKPVEKAR